MSAEIVASRSFVDWYMDPSIAGHAPLVPSIFVGKVCQWIASPLEDYGCEAMIEIVSRALAVIVLPLIALIALLLIPVGLITKSIGGCCTYRESPSTAVVVAKGKPQAAVKRLDVSGCTRIPGSRLPTRLPTPVSNLKTYSEQTLALTAPANATLLNINTLLDKVSVRKIDMDTVKAAKQSLESDSNIRQLRDTTPLENAEKNDPIVTIRDRINIVEARIRSLEFIFHYHSKTIEHNGEMIVPNNGDCLFEASGWLSQMSGSIIASNEEERAASTVMERTKTMVWIQERYRSDQEEELRRRLVSSMAEHYQTKLEKLETDYKGKQEMLLKGLLTDPQQQREAKEQIVKLRQEMDQLFMIMVKISEAFGEAHHEEINFPAVADLAESYIQDMLQPGEHGGAAELYALSHQHEVCIHVYAKNEKIAPNPYETLNPKYLEKKPARHFTHTRNHYNPYFPPA